jgi:hypothetical protein
MTRFPTLSPKILWTASLAALLAVGILASGWLAPRAEAQVGGYSQVTRLEVQYFPADGVLEARFHMASGIALDSRYEDDRSIDRLLQAAEVFARGGTRMFAAAKDDRIVAWRLSIP